MILNALGGINQPIDKFLQGIYPQSTLTYASSHHFHHFQYIQYIPSQSHHTSPLSFPVHPSNILLPSHPSPITSQSNQSHQYIPSQFIPFHPSLFPLSHTYLPSLHIPNPSTIPFSTSHLIQLFIQLSSTLISHPVHPSLITRSFISQIHSIHIPSHIIPPNPSIPYILPYPISPISHYLNHHISHSKFISNPSIYLSLTYPISIH